eukprot:CAMPEP_0114021282 /NCGR_PEP_ID=MMETSP0372-20130328/18274_1 /TAXON_ID=340204 /ORGANISM="Lankesteria abbotti" /LENGTH=48 /assembly_acc=CAM_ASM_000359
MPTNITTTSSTQIVFPTHSAFPNVVPTSQINQPPGSVPLAVRSVPLTP